MHKHFYSFSASSHNDLGLQMGKQFQSEAQKSFSGRDGLWSLRKQTAEAMLPFALEYFPNYIEELKGYATGAGVDFLDFWTMSLEDDAFATKNKNFPKCTSMITNDGLLVAHNEDSFEAGHAEDICIVQKNIGSYTSLEIFYYNTIGGTAIGVNSHGFAQTINTLLFTRKQIGVPKTMAGRFLMDTADPDKDIAYVKKLKRTSGSNHNIVRKDGRAWNVEFTMSSAKQSTPQIPFGHTNHCIVPNKLAETRDSYGTASRLQMAKRSLKPHMTESEMMSIQADNSEGDFSSVMNERTIGKMIVNFTTMNAKIWLLRENDLGWVDYPLDFIK